MNSSKFKKNIWVILCTVICIVTIICLGYMYHHDNDNYRPVHHSRHVKIAPKSSSEAPASPHIFGFTRIKYYLVRPSLAKKWSREDNFAITHYAKIDNLSASQYKFLITMMSWYDYPAQEKYHVRFSQWLIHLTNQDYQKKIHNQHTAQSTNTKAANQIRRQTLIKINQIRAQKHLKPYHNSNNLQRLANIRAYQTNQAYLSEPNKFEKEKLTGNDKNSDNWIHGIDKKQSNIDDAKHYKINISVMPNQKTHDGMIDENAGPIYLGKGIISDIHFHKVENNKNLKSIADNSVDDMVYHDNFAHNGHRKAILAKHHSIIGIGVFFNKNAKHHQKGAIIEEFE